MADNLKIQAIPARQCQRDVDVGFNDGSLTAVINGYLEDSGIL